MNNNKKKFKHLTLDDRIEIMECLYKGMSFKSIAKRIAKDPIDRIQGSEASRKDLQQWLYKDQRNLSAAAQSALRLQWL